MMTWKQVCGWFVLAAVISYSAAVSLREAQAVTATVGEPYVLKFGYDGPRDGVKYRFTKDGKPLLTAKFRVFQLLRRLSFVEITESDAGLYHFEVEGSGIRYSKTINLLGILYIICK